MNRMKKNLEQLLPTIALRVTLVQNAAGRSKADNLARIDALESVKSPDADFLDRHRIGDAQRGKPDQQRKAQQPGIADAPLEPPR